MQNVNNHVSNDKPSDINFKEVNRGGFLKDLTPQTSGLWVKTIYNEAKYQSVSDRTDHKSSKSDKRLDSVGVKCF